MATPPSIDAQTAAVIVARVSRGDRIADIARELGLNYNSLYVWCKREIPRFQERTEEYQATVLEGFLQNWKAFNAQMELVSDRDYLLDFPKDKIPELITTTANQGFRFLGVFDFSEDEAEEAPRTHLDGESHPEPLDGEFVETNPLLTAGDSLPQ